ncbi:MAG: FkbM family methyltransferase, partial [Thermodesulfobacteriota bacterium]
MRRKNNSNLEEVPKNVSEYTSPLLINRIKRAYTYGSVFILARKGIAKVISSFLMKLLGIKKNLDLSGILPTPAHIVDVGAADGFDPRWRQFGSKLHLTLFEPDSESFDKLRTDYKNDPRVKCLKIALSSSSGKRKFYMTAWPRASSVYKPNEKFFEKHSLRDYFKIVRTIEVETRKLVDCCEPFDFIKIDTEGHELDILLGAENLIDGCVGVLIEVHFNDMRYNGDAPLFGDVDNYIRSKGFKLIEIRSPTGTHYLVKHRNLQSKGFILSSDFLYFRLPTNVIELLRDGKWELKQIAKTAALYLSLGNFEFAYILMREAVCNGLISDQ